MTHAHCKGRSMWSSIGPYASLFSSIFQVYKCCRMVFYKWIYFHFLEFIAVSIYPSPLSPHSNQ